LSLQQRLPVRLRTHYSSLPRFSRSGYGVHPTTTLADRPSSPSLPCSTAPNIVILPAPSVLGPREPPGGYDPKIRIW
ncbi:hypothetical protein FA13DRAFT_1772731, partial [Coprinellus micaceus]